MSRNNSGSQKGQQRTRTRKPDSERTPNEPVHGSAKVHRRRPEKVTRREMRVTCRSARASGMPEF